MVLRGVNVRNKFLVHKIVPALCLKQLMLHKFNINR